MWIDIAGDFGSIPSEIPWEKWVNESEVLWWNNPRVEKLLDNIVEKLFKNKWRWTNIADETARKAIWLLPVDDKTPTKPEKYSD